jgi:hypothetical protein
MLVLVVRVIEFQVKSWNLVNEVFQSWELVPIIHIYHKSIFHPFLVTFKKLFNCPHHKAKNTPRYPSTKPNKLQHHQDLNPSLLHDKIKWHVHEPIKHVICKKKEKIVTRASTYLYLTAVQIFSSPIPCLDFLLKSLNGFHSGSSYDC